MIEFLIGAYLMISAVTASVIAKRKNRSTNNWYTIGMFSGVIGIIAVLLVPSLGTDEI